MSRTYNNQWLGAGNSPFGGCSLSQINFPFFGEWGAYSHLINTFPNYGPVPIGLNSKVSGATFSAFSEVESRDGK